MPKQPAIRLPSPLNLDPKYPPLPRTVVGVLELMRQARDGEEPVDALIRLVEDDAITAHYVLKRVNSAFYGLRKPVGNIAQAVRLLGFREVVHLVLATGLIQLGQVFKEPEQREIFQTLLKHSAAVARVAALLMRDYPETGHDMGYATSLLHEMGRLILLYNAPDIYEALWMGVQRTTGRFLPSSVEEEAFGLTFTDVGERAFAHWRFPEEMGLAVRFQEHPEAARALAPEVYQLTQLVACSCTAAHVLFESSPWEEDEQDLRLAGCAAWLNIPSEALLKWLEGYREDVLAYVQAIFSA